MAPPEYILQNNLLYIHVYNYTTMRQSRQTIHHIEAILQLIIAVWEIDNSVWQSTITHPIYRWPRTMGCYRFHSLLYASIIIVCENIVTTNEALQYYSDSVYHLQNGNNVTARR